MQIFKWMPIKADEQQSTTDRVTTTIHQSIDVYKSQEQKREVLASNDNQINTITSPGGDGGSRLVGAPTSAMNSKVSPGHTNGEQQLASNGSHTSSRQSPGTNLNNNFTSMHQQIQEEHGNKRKLNQLDLMSSDSCGSSSCSSSGSLNDSNSNSPSAELERASKRQRVHEVGVGGDQPVDMLESLGNEKAPEGADRRVSLAPMNPNDHLEETTSKQEESIMMVDDSTGALAQTNPIHDNNERQSRPALANQIPMDEGGQNDELLVDVARSVTEQIVSRVSDCYMNI